MNEYKQLKETLQKAPSMAQHAQANTGPKSYAHEDQQAHWNTDSRVIWDSLG